MQAAQRGKSFATFAEVYYDLPWDTKLTLGGASTLDASVFWFGPVAPGPMLGLELAAGF